MMPIRLLPSIFLVLGFFAGCLPAQIVDYTVVADYATVQPEPGLNLVAAAYGAAMPGPEIRLVEGQTLRVRFINNLPEPSSLHWHGLAIPAGMDGVPGISRPPVEPGQEFTYEFAANESGTYWFHPHTENQMNTGLHGALIVDPANPAADPPFDVDYTVFLDDGTGPLTMAMGMGGTATIPAFPGTGTLNAHLLNGRTSAGQVPFAVSAGQKVRFRFINVAAMENYVVALDGHPMTVTHADGRRVVPVVRQAIPIGIGERYDVVVEMNNPGVWSLAASAITNRSATLVRGIVAYSGATGNPPSASFVPNHLSNGSLLDYTDLAAADAVPVIAAPSRTYGITLGMSMGPGPMRFTFNGESWPNVTPFLVAEGEEVRVTLANAFVGPLMANEMWHPIHVHGHLLRLMNTAGGLAAPPVKDTILIRPVGQGTSTQTFQFTADNPGAWMFHCHDIMHMDMGMMGLIHYTGDSDGDGLSDKIDLDPVSAYPVLTVDSAGGGFALGSTVHLDVQWPAGNTVWYCFGGEVASPLDLGLLGRLHLDPYYVLGLAVSGSSHVATLPVTIPADPVIGGLVVPLQAIATHATLAPGGRISTFQRLRL